VRGFRVAASSPATVYEGDEDIHSALEAGAQAYLLKNVLPSPGS
jgi:DNA-binding NarL/FixJ family response regulator